MLDVEAALAVAAARLELVPDAAAASIAAVCRAELFDLAEVGRRAAAEATPVIEVVRQLRVLVPETARPFVHFAATSQDVLDSASSLVSRRALQPALDDASVTAGLLARLARQHRDTAMVGRTLLQHGATTTYGALCAARLVAIDEAVAAVRRVDRVRLAVQLGGAVGTLSPAGAHGPDLVHELAVELALTEPVVPWHTSRGRVAELAGAIGVVTGELAAVAQDVVLLSSTEIGEVSVATPGGSSAMPHKENPAAAALALACAHRVPTLVATVLAGMPQELQRSAGRWQAEPGTLTDLLRLFGGTANHARTALDGLRVDTARMQRHVEAFLAATGASSADPGSAGAFVDRALRHHDEQP